MKLLLFCFVGLVATTVGTMMLDGIVQHICQIGFLVVAAISVLLGLGGQI